MNVCKICGDEFLGKSKRASFCPKDHYRNCKNCGKSYLVKKIATPPEFCSVSCSRTFQNSNSEHKAVCQLCGNEFTTFNSNAKYCKKDHRKNCLKCGKEYIVKNPSKDKDYCSWECSKTGKIYTKNCAFCGEEFTTNNSKMTFCNREHFKQCENIECSKMFKIKNLKRPEKGCSPECTKKIISQKFYNDNRVFVKTCEFCGDEFKSKVSHSRFCSKSHKKTCPCCGEEFIVNPRHPAKTCSNRKCVDSIIDYEARSKKISDTVERKYGVGIKNVSQSNEVKEVKKSIMLERYGVENASCYPEFKAKREKTNLERYGVKNSGGAPEVQERVKATIKEKYGVENVFQSKEVKEKTLKTLSDKYGKQITNVSQVAEINAKARQTCLERYGVDQVLSLPEVQLAGRGENAKRVSKLNREWQKKLEEALGVPVALEVFMGDSNYVDLCVDDRVFIDVNPTVTHNSSIHFVHLTKRCSEENCVKVEHEPMSRTYHYQRALYAEEHHKVFLQYFDWYDDKIFVSIVRSKLGMDENKVGARKCEVKRISQSEANSFFQENHLLGRVKDQSFCVGLFYEDTLVHVQSYGPSRFNKRYEWEAIRSCSKMNWFISGAVSRCDKFFIKSVNPSSIVSYVDLSISTGETESKNPGWKLLSVNKPQAMWVKASKSKNSDGPSFVRDASVRRLSADTILNLKIGEVYPEKNEDGTVFTNEQVMVSEGYLKVFDAGTKSFGWRSED